MEVIGGHLRSLWRKRKNGWKCECVAKGKDTSSFPPLALDKGEDKEVILRSKLKQIVKFVLFNTIFEISFSFLLEHLQL